MGGWCELYPVCFGIFFNFAKAVRGHLIVLSNAFFLEIGHPHPIVTLITLGRTPS